MNEERDQLHSVLREWEAPPVAPAMDERVLEGYRKAHRSSWWQRIWSARVTIPVPALAAALLLLAAIALFEMGPGRRGAPVPSAPAIIASPDAGYTTRIETAGFKPLPDGATRVIRSGAKQ